MTARQRLAWLPSDLHRLMLKLASIRGFRGRNFHPSGLDLRQQLSILVLAAIVPLIILTIVLFNHAIDREREMTSAALLSSFRTLAGLVDNEVDTYVAIASTLASQPELKKGDFAQFLQVAKEALTFVPGSWLSVSDPSGKVILHTLRDYGENLTKSRNSDELAKVFASKRPYLSDLKADLIGSRLAVFVEYPVFQNNVPLYMIEIGIPPSRFLSIVQGKFSQGDRVGILDRQLKFIARIPDQETRMGTLASQDWRKTIARTPQEGLAEVVTLEGDKSLTAYAGTTRGWIAGVSVSAAVLNAGAGEVLRSLIVIAISLIFVSLTLAFLIARQFTSSMHRLTSAARDLGAGRIIAPLELTFKEATIIGQALSQASRQLKQSAFELEKKVEERTVELVGEMKRREESEEKVRQLQKMEAVGQLTGGIAHDFNNMMAVVLGSLYLLERRLEKGSGGLAPLIEGAKQGAERAVALTKRLLAFSRQQALSPVEIEVNKLVANIADLLRRTVPENIQIETVLAGGLWRVYADPNQLENAVVNLVGNARDAMPDGGKLTIETANTYLDDAYASEHAEVKAGQYVMVAVTDSGPGMTSEVMSKAFEPFFTTKPPGQGTGLGLSQVHGFIRQSGGHVKIYSEDNHGVSVKIYLPRFVSAQNQETYVKEMQNLPGMPLAKSSELILVVEDEEAVRNLTVAMLTELGYATLCAESAASALALLDSRPDIELLLTDVVMPGMNGRQLAAKALERRPDLKVVFTTGYTRNAIVHNGVLDPDVELIMKPFTIETLAAKFAKIFSGA